MSLFISCNKEDHNRKKMASEYTVEKIEFYTIDAANNSTLIKSKEDVGTITLLKSRGYGAGYDFSYVLDTIPDGFVKAWVKDDYLGPPVSRQWSVDVGNRNLLMFQGRNWVQQIDVYAKYTVKQLVGRRSTWSFYTFSGDGLVVKKEVIHLKKH